MTFGGKIVNGILNTKKMSYLTHPHTAEAAASIAIVSNLSKDVVNCYYYVTQSLKNEKIPEEKRKFVAALDLSNGILNFITQLAVGIPITKFVEKYFDKNMAEKYFSKGNAEMMYKKLNNSKISLEKFYGRFSRNRGFARAGLCVISALVTTQIIAKRIIVPFIATPMASFFKKKFEQNSANKTAAPAVNNSALSANNTPDCFKSFK